MRSSISAWLARSRADRSTIAGSGALMSTNCEGWNDSRTSSARALAPTVASSASASRTMAWNCGMSGWVA